MANQMIGLAGKAGAGKDFTFAYLQKKYPNKTFHRIAFADQVRREVEDIVGGGHELPTVWAKPYPDEIRALLQWWGTELRRASDEDYWVNYANDSIEEWKATMRALETGTGVVVPDPDFWVFTDVRFANEAAYIQERSGVVLEVKAMDGMRRRRLGKLPPAHSSEDMDFPTDGHILNDTDTLLPPVLKDYIGEGY